MKRLMVLFAICLLPLSTTALSASGGSEAPPDETVKQAVVDQLVWDNRVDASKIEVEVDLGRVVLSGSVPRKEHFNKWRNISPLKVPNFSLRVVHHQKLLSILSLFHLATQALFQ